MDIFGFEVVESSVVPKGWIVLRGAREIIAAVPTGDGESYRTITFPLAFAMIDSANA